MGKLEKETLYLAASSETAIKLVEGERKEKSSAMLSCSYSARKERQVTFHQSLNKQIQRRLNSK